jgi:hypothetical protein
MVKLETKQDPQVESGDCRLGRSMSDLWKAGTSKAIALTCVG